MRRRGVCGWIGAGVRVVEVLDEGQVRQLHSLYQGEWWSAGRTLEEVRTMLAHSDVVVGLCAADTGRLLAFARVLTDGVFKALIFDVIVDRAHRSEGLGHELMDQILGHPALSVVHHFELSCLPELEPFYERWGFSNEVAGVSLMRRPASRATRAS